MTTINLDAMADEDVRTFFAGLPAEVLEGYAAGYKRVEHLPKFKRLATMVRDEVARRTK